MRNKLRYLWYSFWHKLIYKSIRLGNYRKEINRFTGNHRIYKVHPMARIGVHFKKEQIKFLRELLQNERNLEAQELILEQISEEMVFDGLAEEFIKTVDEADKTENQKRLTDFLNN